MRPVDEFLALFAFRSTRNFHAVCSAPANTSSSAAATARARLPASRENQERRSRNPRALVAENHHPRLKCTIDPHLANALILNHNPHRIEKGALTRHHESASGLARSLH
ncbi:MAG: hypothetical protein WBF06_13945 [Candidatus Acidiferrales bacterium]